MSEKLLPCPFCGGEPEVVLRPDNLWGGYFCNVFCRCDNKYSAEANKSARGADESDVYNKAITAWNRRTQPNEPVCHALIGVMHSVDKWLDDDELKQDEVNRAATMREKVLKIIERLQAESAQLQAERDAAVEDMNTIVSTATECLVCKNRVGASGCPIRYKKIDCFEWRGVKAKEESENG